MKSQILIALSAVLAVLLIASCMNPQGVADGKEDGSSGTDDGNGGSGDGEAASVAAPSFDPGPGRYESDVAVSITAADSAQLIRFTVDGSAPDSSSPEYAAPIDVSGDGANLTISAVAVDDDGSVGEVASGSYTVRYRYEVATSASSGGSVSTTPDGGTVLSGESVEITAYAEPGYDFAAWEPVELGDANPLNIEVTENLSVHASFSVRTTESVLRDGISVHEILPDPTGTPGVDTDGNGSIDSSDEFVELVNGGAIPVLLDGLELWDPGAKLWFTFPEGSELAPGESAVVVIKVTEDGALPAGVALDAASNALLNNGGDAIVLYDPDSDEYLVLGYGGIDVFDPVTELDGFSATATRIGDFEVWNGTYNGRSLSRPSVGAAPEAVVPHTELDGSGASPGETP